jgi:hypothetical protein
MDFFYDGQLRRYVTQFMRIFIGFKYEAGDATQTSVPVMYGDMSRQVANLIRENSENKLPSVPRIACYISSLEMDTSRLTDPTFVSKMNIRERKYNEFDEFGDPVYTGEQGANYTVERLMPTPYKLRMKADIWTSNTEQKLQLLEQILVLFNPSLEIQTTDNYVDWTSLSAVYLSTLQFTSRSVPAGAESEIDICTIEFEMPVWLSPPAKVKKLGIIQSIIANIFTEEGDIQSLEQTIYNERKGEAQVSVNARYPVLLFKSDNGQPYDYDLTLVDPYQAVVSLGLDEKEYKTGNTQLDWNVILDKLAGGYTASSQLFFMQPSGYEMAATFAVNPVDPTVLVVTFDQDTIPTNTTIDSSVVGLSARGTIDAIIDPFKFNPIERWGGAANIPLGTRYLLLETIGDPNNVDGPEGWKGSDGSTQTSYQLVENSIVEWDGTKWATILDPETAANPTYVQNLKTGIQYKWDSVQWLKSFEGEYAPGYWRLDLN